MIALGTSLTAQPGNASSFATSPPAAVNSRAHLTLLDPGLELRKEGLVLGAVDEDHAEWAGMG